jgi:flagellum-specific ATP synthase
MLDSLSRLMPSITSAEHRSKNQQVRALLAAYMRSEDLLRIGAYSAGSDPVLDKAVAALPAIQQFARQTPEEPALFSENIARLHALPV